MGVYSAYSEWMYTWVKLRLELGISLMRCGRVKRSVDSAKDVKERLMLDIFYSQSRKLYGEIFVQRLFEAKYMNRKRNCIRPDHTVQHRVKSL